MLVLLAIVSGADATPAVASSSGFLVARQSSKVLKLSDQVRALGGATEDLNEMEHDVKALLGKGTIDTALCMLLVPLLAPFLCMFFGTTEEKRRGTDAEKASLLGDDFDDLI